MGRREEETEEPPTSMRSDPHPQPQKKHGVETDEDSGDDVPLGPAQGQTKERTPQEFNLLFLVGIIVVSASYYNSEPACALSGQCGQALGTLLKLCW